MSAKSKPFLRRVFRPLNLSNLITSFSIYQWVAAKVRPVRTCRNRSHKPIQSRSLLLENVFFAPLFQALQTPGITRSCAIVDDASFVALAVLRMLENSKPGATSSKPTACPPPPGSPVPIISTPWPARSFPSPLGCVYGASPRAAALSHRLCKLAVPCGRDGVRWISR